MALTTKERHDIRYGCRFGYIKAVTNAAALAVEARIRAPATRNAISGDIDAATQPLGITLNNTEKKRIAAYVFRELFGQDKEG